jgi:2-polyprenyl-3-methyl-5-hydroxy-6-metoxy-1,4-benzoquinol methylase
MSKVNCRICSGATQLSHLLRSNRSDQTVQTYYCRPCNFYFSYGIPVDYTAYHQGFDLIGYYLGVEQYIRARYDKIFSFTESLVAPGRFLDIGAGMGFSLEVAKRRGWTASGLEPNAEVSRHARDRGLDVKNAYLTSETTGEYDFILIDNVLEHILEPTEFVNRAGSLLAPSGVLMVAVPPLDWLRRALGSMSYVRNSVSVSHLNVFLEVDEHVNMFSRTAMSRLLKRAGLKLLDNRFHHRRAYGNWVFRALQLDDGNYFIVRST